MFLPWRAAWIVTSFSRKILNFKTHHKTRLHITWPTSNEANASHLLTTSEAFKNCSIFIIARTTATTTTVAMTTSRRLTGTAGAELRAEIFGVWGFRLLLLFVKFYASPLFNFSPMESDPEERRRDGGKGGGGVVRSDVTRVHLMELLMNKTSENLRRYVLFPSFPSIVPFPFHLIELFDKQGCGRGRQRTKWRLIWIAIAFSVETYKWQV